MQGGEKKTYNSSLLCKNTLQT